MHPKRSHMDVKDRAVNVQVSGVYTHAERSHMNVKDPAVNVWVWWITETPKQPSMHWQMSSFAPVVAGHSAEEEDAENLLISSNPLQKWDNLIAFKLLAYQLLKLDGKTKNHNINKHYPICKPCPKFLS